MSRVFAFSPLNIRPRTHYFPYQLRLLPSPDQTSPFRILRCFLIPRLRCHLRWLQKARNIRSLLRSRLHLLNHLAEKYFEININYQAKLKINTNCERT